ncbi:uncharacterized protein LOC119282634 [Triticum dicoccoides]|uniref:uncharacterized protein LOC119282634 n=1 Tax=Triticum dicoccoides TaxID=85692 RepID=UPI000E7B32E3|nr:uncharacterized protein LOC119282634 [Triticum dicoccoides]
MKPTWPDLLPELVREISGRLHDVADFVRFHAICKPWRDSHHPTTTRTTDQFLPWLLAPSKKGDDSLNFRCVFSNTSYRAPPPPPISGTDGQMNWVASADGTTICYFTPSPDGPTLHNPLGGGPLTNMPLFPEDVNGELGENPNGILYNDGTVLLYRKHDSSDDDTAEFKAALLCPGNDEWTFVKRTLESPYYGEFCVAYHAGKILVTVKDDLWLVVTAPSAAANNDQVLLPKLSWMPCEHDGRYYEYSYVLESHGELLWVSVHIKMDYLKESSTSVCDLVQALSMSVHTLEEVTKGPEKLRWVRKVGRSLADRVLFLGWPNSFAVDASRLGVSGGFTYFLFYDNHRLRKRHGVFRYNLIDNTTELIEWLPQGWDNEMCAWLVPQPTIAPINRALATTPRINSMIHIERCYGLLSQVFVRNLPLHANDSQLQQLFSKYGRVSSAKVTYYKKTKTLRGLITIATMHVCQDDALAALDGLVLDGCRLEVISVKGR